MGDFCSLNCRGLFLELPCISEERVDESLGGMLLCPCWTRTSSTEGDSVQIERGGGSLLGELIDEERISLLQVVAVDQDEFSRCSSPFRLAAVGMWDPWKCEVTGKLTSLHCHFQISKS